MPRTTPTNPRKAADRSVRLFFAPNFKKSREVWVALLVNICNGLDHGSLAHGTDDKADCHTDTSDGIQLFHVFDEIFRIRKVLANDFEGRHQDGDENCPDNRVRPATLVNTKNPVRYTVNVRRKDSSSERR
jgi:hypothetical protein